MWRPEHTTRPDSPDIEWVEWALNQVYCDAFSILRVTSPFRTAEHIRGAWHKFSGMLGADSLRAVRRVTEHPGKMWVVAGRLMYPLLPMGMGSGPETPPWNSRATQDLFPCYIQTAGLEFAWSNMVLETHTIAGDCVVPYVLEGAAALDINTKEDWLEAERLVQSFG